MTGCFSMLSKQYLFTYIYDENKFKTRINKAIKEALNQIDRNRYYKELIDNKIKPENIIKLAIVFAGKEPFILQD